MTAAQQIKSNDKAQHTRRGRSKNKTTSEIQINSATEQMSDELERWLHEGADDVREADNPDDRDRSMRHSQQREGDNPPSTPP